MNKIMADMEDGQLYLSLKRVYDQTVKWRNMKSTSKILYQLEGTKCTST